MYIKIRPESEAGAPLAPTRRRFERKLPLRFPAGPANGFGIDRGT